jgi:ATP-dependent DNA helicase RecG
MKNLGYVQRFGVGIALARQQLEANGNPPLELEPTHQNVLVVVRRRP